MKGQKALGEAQSEHDPEDRRHKDEIRMQRAIAVGRRGLLAQLLVGVGFSYPVPLPRLGIERGEELVDVDVDLHGRRKSRKLSGNLQAVSGALGSVTCNAQQNGRNH